MPAQTLAALPKGHRFPPTSFALLPEWVREYTESVEDAAIAALDPDAVPPMAVAALAIRALLEQAGLPAGTIHAAQELTFRRAMRAGEELTAGAQIVSRGERQGWVLMSVELSVESAGEPAMAGRATITFPVDGDGA